MSVYYVTVTVLGKELLTVLTVISNHTGSLKRAIMEGHRFMMMLSQMQWLFVSLVRS